LRCFIQIDAYSYIIFLSAYGCKKVQKEKDKIEKKLEILASV